MRSTVLIVEDEPAIADNVAYALRTDGFDVLHVALAAEALAALAAHDIAAVVLDVGLPDGNGFELCRRIRQQSDVPVLFVTARGDEVDRIVGLEIGADDYVVKPFSPRELVARVRTVLRRVRAAPQDAGANRPVAGPPVAPAQSSFVVDATRACIHLDGTALDLTRHEYLLLERMLREPGRVFGRDQLLQEIGATTASMGRSVDTHVKSLRAKLRTVAPERDAIRTHRGLGYSIHP
jgi:two-component system catabolic regulation response regulator CreB